MESVVSLTEKLRIRFSLLPHEAWHNRLREIKELVENRNKANLHQLRLRQESVQQFKRGRLHALKAQEEEILTKKDSLQKERSKLQVELKEIELAKSKNESKLKEQQRLNTELQERVAELKLEKEESNEAFKKTWKQYLTVMAWYKKFLGIYVKFDANDPDSVMVAFGYNVDHLEECNPHVKFKIESDYWKLLHFHPSLDGWEKNIDVLEEGYEITNFLYKVRRAFIQAKILRKQK